MLGGQLRDRLAERGGVVHRVDDGDLFPATLHLHEQVVFLQRHLSPTPEGKQHSEPLLCDNPKNGAAQRPSVVAPVLLHAHQRMENDTRTIKEVVKTVRDPGGEEIAIVRCSDGTYGVARDGKLI